MAGRREGRQSAIGRKLIVEKSAGPLGASAIPKETT
jgi:hypothetical protein